VTPRLRWPLAHARKAAEAVRSALASWVEPAGRRVPRVPNLASPSGLESQPGFAKPADPAPAATRPRGLVFQGTVWPGGHQAPLVDGLVLVDSHGTVAGLGPRGAMDVPNLPRFGGPHHWVGPSVIDTHVRYGVGSVDEASPFGGVVAVRDLTDLALRDLILSGASAGEVSQLVASGSAAGAQWVSLELRPGDKPPPRSLVAVAQAADSVGLPFLVHTRSLPLALRALAAGADGLGSVPLDPMDDDAVETFARHGVAVTGLLQDAYPSGAGGVAARNAALLHAAGVTLLYGSGATRGTPPRVDPRELERLAAAGLGRWGAMRAATDLAARARGLESRSLTGRLVRGQRAELVVLADDPTIEPAAWRSAVAVCSGTRVSSDSASPRTWPTGPAPSSAGPAERVLA